MSETIDLRLLGRMVSRLQSSVEFVRQDNAGMRATLDAINVTIDRRNAEFSVRIHGLELGQMRLADSFDQLHLKVDRLEVDVADLKADVSTLKADMVGVNARLDAVNARLDNVDSRLDNVDSRLDKIDSRLDKIDSRLDEVLRRLPER